MTHAHRRVTVGLLIAAALASAAAHAAAQQKGSLAYLDAKNGFRDIKFGTPESEVVRRLQLEPFNEGEEVLYRRKDETLSLGNVALTDIRYRFLNHKFFAVSLIAHDASSSPSLLDVVQAAFGPGTCSGQRLCSWKGEKVEAQYKETATELPVFSMWSQTVAKETSSREQATQDAERKARATAAAAAADDL